MLARQQLFDEAVLMAQFDHPNILSLIGVCTRNNSCMILLEYCHLGSLYEVLRTESEVGGDTWVLNQDTGQFTCTVGSSVWRLTNLLDI